MKNLFPLLFLSMLGTIVSAQDVASKKQKDNLAFPELLVFSNQFENYFSSKNKIEKIVSGKTFLEGPVWVESLNGLLFSDISENKIYFWNKKNGVSLWLEPSGDANGLLVDANGDLLLMQGNAILTHETKRQIGKIVNPKSNKTIADFVTKYEGKKFNSPNDIAMSSKGVLYFTDPDFGLKIFNPEKVEKELSFNGVYKYQNGKLKVLIDTLDQPNGIGISPDDKFLYVSDGIRLLCYELDNNGEIVKSLNFFHIDQVWEHMIPSTKIAWQAWDGMAVSKEGVIIAAGCGGVWFFSRTGVVLGHIQTPEFTTNTAVDDKGEYLYWTAGKLPSEKGESCLYRYKLR
jgi:gluconolactonase